MPAVKVIRSHGKQCASVLLIVLLLAVSAGCATTGGVTGPVSKAGAPSVLQGLCFSPFVNESPSSPVPISHAQIVALIEDITPYTRGIRTFSSSGIGADMAKTAKSRGLFVAAGCDLYTDPAHNEAEVRNLIQLAREGSVDLAVVGEEALYSGFVTEGELVGYIDRVKAAGVRATTSDTWGELVGHPKVMAACDVVMANMFPYWEKSNIIGSVAYLDSCYRKIKDAAGGKEIIVETGWPFAGETRGEAVASPDNARWFLSRFTAWAAVGNVKYYYFEAFDEPWKASREGAVGANWGLWDQYGKLKPGLERIIGTSP
jgi:exo-beta-1,3-glucanase (GH17 family)